MNAPSDEDRQATGPYRLRDPRQVRIHERLSRLVGPGPADHFRDACRAMEEPTWFLSTTNLVGHLLREIEDALRDVLAPMTSVTDSARESRRNQLEKILRAESVDPLSVLAASLGELVRIRNPRSLRPTHREQIRSILSALEIDHTDAVAATWLRFAGGDYSLPRFAHRRNFDAPRPVDARFVGLWNDIIAVLDATLSRFEERYDGVFHNLAALRTLEAPTASDALTLVTNTPNNVVARRFFFDGLENPAWLPLLDKKGVFRSPPAPIVDPDGKTVSHILWPESRYLARMARRPEEQVIVGRIVEEMEETENIRVIVDLIEVVSSLSASLGRSTRERVLRWAERQQQLVSFVSEGLTGLAAHLAVNEDLDGAKEILRILLTLGQVPRGDYGGRRARIEPWDYRRILSEELVRVGLSLGSYDRLEFLLDLLEKGDVSGGEPTHFWRGAIEESEQNTDNSAANTLISAIRDAAEAFVGEESSRLDLALDRLTRTEAQSPAKRRLALNLLRTSAVVDADRIAAALLDPKAVVDLDAHHEYYTLLRDRFATLPTQKQELLLELLESAPYLEVMKAQRASKGEPPMTAEEEDKFRRRATRESFALIATHLSGERLTRYQRIVEESGEAKHPEFLFYSESSFGFVGSRSPRSADDLSELSVPALATFLETWVPASNPFEGPSREGLGDALAELVASSPTSYSAGLPALQSSEPTYVRGIIRGFTKALSTGKAAFWPLLLEYCLWALKQEDLGGVSEPLGRDRGWRWTRDAILDLLEAGLKGGEARVPIEQRYAVWAILEKLVRDPSSPMLESESKSSDLVMTAINSLRGRALQRVIEYAFWIREQLGDSEGIDLDRMPEVREVLDSRLDPQNEPSAAIRAVYGLELVRLFVLDRGWLAAAKERIFPVDPIHDNLRRAAWSAYLSYVRVYDDVYRLIADVYDRAIEALAVGNSGDDARTWPKLGEHLAILYWRGIISLDSERALSRFLSLAPEEIRAHVIDVLGRALRDLEQPIAAPVRERLERLWVARLDAIRGGGLSAKRELAAFARWFASNVFEPSWAAARLLEAAELREGLPADHWLLEALGDRAAIIPLQSLQILRFIALGETDATQFSFEGDQIRKVLLVGRGLASTEAISLIKEIVGRIAAKGCPDFIDLGQE